jgi:UDP-glucose 4-epimerase
VGRIAVTGVASSLGTRLLRRLVERRGAEAVVAVDIASPPATLGVRHRFVDLTHPVSDQQLLDVFRQEEVRCVVHLAFFTNPQRDADYAHELESIGTLNLLAAAAAAGVPHVIVRSFTAVYGARGQNPGFLSEEMALRPDASLAWVRDKLEAEQHAASFARRYPEMTVSVLRLAFLMGPGIRTFYTRIFDHRAVPVLMGFDPLLQLLHPDDALAALEAAIDHAPGGAVNVVPKDTVPLISALHLAAKVPFPVPHLLAYPVAEALWASGLGEGPAGLLDYVRYPFRADGEKAVKALGFTARHSSREALLAYLRYRHPRAARRAEAAL